jgi:hypothetical protein
MLLWALHLDLFFALMCFPSSHDECLGIQPPICGLFNKFLGIRDIHAEQCNTKWTKLSTIAASQQINRLSTSKLPRSVQTRALRKINNSNLLNGSEFGIVSQCEQIGCSKRSDNTTFVFMEPAGMNIFFPRKRLTNLALQLSVTVHSKSFLCDF